VKNKLGGEIMDDVKLLQGIKAKKPACYEALIDRYISYVTVVVSSVAKDSLSSADIEEISSDVFIKIWTDGHKISLQGETLKPYLAKIARNMTINKLRKTQRYEVLPLNEDIITASGDGTENEVINLEDTRVINETVNSLGEPDKEIFIRRYFYLEKVTEIAQRLEINENTVATKLSRARKYLKSQLIERGVTI
jgi:RNA polymerase sigma-70 factor, ECF subfamily